MFAELLERTEDRGYPTEYLLSRMKARKAALIRDWRPLLAASNPREHLPPRYAAMPGGLVPDAVWGHLLKEFRWSYVQMNGGLREILSPFFLYSELRTLFICLRNIRAGEPMKNETLLSVSLLSGKMKGILGKNGDIRTAVGGIERVFASLSDRFKGMQELLGTSGLQEVEKEMTNRYLEHVLLSAPHPVVRDLFVRIVDSRNILALHKFVNLGAKTPLSFVRRGRITRETFFDAVAKRDNRAVVALIGTFTGPESLSGTTVENALYKSVSRFLKRAAVDPLSVGPILDYLWSCSIEVRNLSVLFHGSEIERATLEAEIIG